MRYTTHSYFMDAFTEVGCDVVKNQVFLRRPLVTGTLRSVKTSSLASSQPSFSSFLRPPSRRCCRCRLELFVSEYLAGRPPEERPLLARPKSCSLLQTSKWFHVRPLHFRQTVLATLILEYATFDFTSWPSEAVVSFQECDWGPRRWLARHL